MALSPLAQSLLPDPAKPLRDHAEKQLLAMCLFGEARGQPAQTRNGIGHAIINRALHPAWWGKTLTGVILKAWQFSSFNGPETIPKIKPEHIDPNYQKLRDPLRYEAEWVWEHCCQSAELVYRRFQGEQIEDPVIGANHYYDTSIPAPTWADVKKLTVILPAGRKGHMVRFYRL